METLYRTLVLICALSHVGFMVLEMFLWTKPLGLKIFHMSAAQAEATKVLASNQGLYNGFLAAGLLWGFLGRNYEVHLFFLVCILLAGLWGGFTASPTIYFVQAMPALVALIVFGFIMYA